jgi:hypothetical protein
MPRPPEEHRVRTLVEADLTVAEAAVPAGRIPISTTAVSRRTHVHRKTLARYGLDTLIEQTAARMRERIDVVTRRERKTISDHLGERDSKIAQLERANELLVARIALAEANAQRLSIDPAELWRPVTPPPRTLPYTPRRRGVELRVHGR